MIVDAILRFLATCLNGLIKLIPNINMPTGFEDTVTQIKAVVQGCAYFLPVTAIKIFFGGIIAYYLFMGAKYIVMLLIKYVTRML